MLAAPRPATVFAADVTQSSDSAARNKCSAASRETSTGSELTSDNLRERIAARQLLVGQPERNRRHAGACKISLATRSLGMRAMIPLPPHSRILRHRLGVVARRDVEAPRTVEPRVRGDAAEEFAAEAASGLDQQHDSWECGAW